VEVKGKGRMDTYIWRPQDEPGGLMPPDVAAAVACARVGWRHVRTCVFVFLLHDIAYCPGFSAEFPANHEAE